MSKIRAIYNAYEEWHLDDDGKPEEFAVSLDADTTTPPAYYLCVDCNDTLETWPEANKHISKCSNKGFLE